MPSGSEWQPIETVPKDGTPILLFTMRKGFSGEYDWPRVAAWQKDQSYMNGKPMGEPWYGWAQYQNGRVEGEFNAYFRPTHWMPLPEPPTC